MRRVAPIALALTLVGGCFVDPGPGGATSSGTGSTSAASATTGAATSSATTTTGTATGTSGSSGAVTATEGPTSTTSATTSEGSTGEPATTGEPGTSTGGAFMPPCAAYYATDFSEEPALDWDVLTNAWSWDAQQGLYRGSYAMIPGALTRLDVGTWDDVRVHARLKIEANAAGGVFVRADTSLLQSYLYVQLEGSKGTVSGYVGGMDAALFNFGGAFAAGQWVDLEILMIGTTLALSLDGKSLANGIQILDLPKGAIGLAVLAGGVEFDELWVCPPK